MVVEITKKEVVILSTFLSIQVLVLSQGLVLIAGIDMNINSIAD
ncbi:hypothetical protein ABIE27_003015 [Paenibacillus sp. 4624]|jgi:hypothetical protein|nr:hypothetical protein [Paenibacillus amylolyticus]